MDAKTMVVRHLNAAGRDYTTYRKVPESPPARFRVVQRTGGPRGDLVLEQAMLSVYCYGGTDGGCERMAEETCDDLESLLWEEDNVFAVNIVTADAEDDDIERGLPRHQVVVELFGNN